MKRIHISLIRTGVILILLTSVYSCSYGFFNFSGDTGDIQLAFEFENDNALGVDKIIFELTSPSGQSASSTMYFSGSRGHSSLSNADIGLWKVTAELYSGDELIQKFDDIDDLDDKDGIEVVKDSSTTVNIRARWNAIEYELYVDSWVDSFDSANTASGDDNGDDSTAFSFTSMSVIPVAYESYRTGERQEEVIVRALGSDFSAYLASLQLSFPDGLIYEFGYDYNRSIEFNLPDDSSPLEIKRDVIIGGNYTLRLCDWGNTVESKTVSISLNVDQLMPSITTSGIPLSLDNAVDHYFDYTFDPSSEIGTRLVFLVDRNTSAVLPTDGTMAVSNYSGAFPVLIGTLTAGHEYDFIVAGLQYETNQPYIDAVSAGVTDMRIENFSDSIYSIYGEETGFILYKSVRFTAF